MGKILVEIITIIFMGWFLKKDVPHLRNDGMKVEERIGRIVLSVLLMGLIYSFFKDLPTQTPEDTVFFYLFLGIMAYFARTAFSISKNERGREENILPPWSLP